MKISWKWLLEILDASNALSSPEKCAEILISRGLEVEEITPLSKGFEKVITAQILDKKPHPQADRLSLCQVTTRKGESLEIVCGAQNMQAGDKVVLAEVGACLPNGLKIEQTKIRGIVSNGMLCSEEELKLKESSEGILILPPETPLGIPMAEVLGRDDTILAFKLTPNRGDCLSHFGMARELAAALGIPLKELGFQKYPSLKAATQNAQAQNFFVLHLDALEAAPQFWGVLLEGVQVGPSPSWLVHRLEGLGFRSINNVVDATNLVMLELGHPLHAYDADRLRGHDVYVRFARAGEVLPLLDGSNVTLEGFELVIADDKNASRPIGLAGVMGGGNSEVSTGTTRLLLECAEFSPHLVRRAAQKHLRRTEAAHRFERGVDPMGLERAISRLAQRVVELAGGRVVGVTQTVLPARDLTKSYRRLRVPFSPQWINQFLGTAFSEELIINSLVSQGCGVDQEGAKSWSAVIPSYRLDLSMPEDLAEEVARTVGYDAIPTTVPALTSCPIAMSANGSGAEWFKLEQAKTVLSNLGFLESINYAFTSQNWLSQFGMSSSAKILNPLSEEFEYLVPSLLPGLIRNVLENERHHFGSEALPVRLFEVRPVFKPMREISAQGEMETGMQECWRVAWVMSGPRFAGALRVDQSEIDFFDLKAVAESFLNAVGARGVRFQSSQAPYFHSGQCVEILTGSSAAGSIGMLHPRLSKNLKLRSTLWIAELDWHVLHQLTPAIYESRHFKSWPEFPTMERDFALLVKKEVRADQITQLALKAGKPIAKLAKVFDIYQGSQVTKGMTSVAVRVIFFDERRSLQESETEVVCRKILETWKKELGVELRS